MNDENIPSGIAALPHDPMVRLLKAAKELGWEVAVPKMRNDDADVPGLIVGTSVYVDKVLGYIPEHEEWESPRD